MNKLGIKSIVTKKFRPSSNKGKIVEREKLLKRNFQTSTINEKWVTDITYIYTIKDGWCYLASVMDLHSKKIVGYSMSKTINTKLALQVLKNAIDIQKTIKSLILHSDLGCQYTSSAFMEYIMYKPFI